MQDGKNYGKMIALDKYLSIAGAKKVFLKGRGGGNMVFEPISLIQ
jgi:hypothetical protein